MSFTFIDNISPDSTNDILFVLFFFKKRIDIVHPFIYLDNLEL